MDIHLYCICHWWIKICYRTFSTKTRVARYALLQTPVIWNKWFQRVMCSLNLYNSINCVMHYHFKPSLENYLKGNGLMIDFNDFSICIWTPNLDLKLHHNIIWCDSSVITSQLAFYTSKTLILFQANNFIKNALYM